MIQLHNYVADMFQLFIQIYTQPHLTAYQERYIHTWDIYQDNGKLLIRYFM